MPRKPSRAKALGVSDEQYAAMLETQGGGCAICGATPKTRRLHVDHDHADKGLRVRGLLCHRCNRALPTWITRAWLTKAHLYLAKADPDSRFYTAGSAGVQASDVILDSRSAGDPLEAA